MTKYVKVLSRYCQGIVWYHHVYYHAYYHVLSRYYQGTIRVLSTYYHQDIVRALRSICFQPVPALYQGLVRAIDVCDARPPQKGWRIDETRKEEDKEDIRRNGWFQDFSGQLYLWHSSKFIQISYGRFPGACHVNKSMAATVGIPLHYKVSSPRSGPWKIGQTSSRKWRQVGPRATGKNMWWDLWIRWNQTI